MVCTRGRLYSLTYSHGPIHGRPFTRHEHTREKATHAKTAQLGGEKHPTLNSSSSTHHVPHQGHGGSITFRLRIGTWLHAIHTGTVRYRMTVMKLQFGLFLFARLITRYIGASLWDSPLGSNIWYTRLQVPLLLRFSFSRGSIDCIRNVQKYQGWYSPPIHSRDL